MQMNQSSSTHQPITLHPPLVRRIRATALLGEALIRYQVSHTLGDRIHLLALASMANTLGALTKQDADVINTALAKPVQQHTSKGA
ncbi:hypothetical protein QE393_001664 [Pseudomonas sp. SORGH_AS 211]|uniref:hypothetical protein n=1 Tax=Pseudomonas sp. SORGH_AS_0211 TaxID=3041796 RepID=UPI00285718BD|nr:hypothetical protein [Pseudomonas sp. SORGH_AS_0211]MDR6178404.1 hypothetical protein [Pseudomonas sp. SORGH_AS_0211]